MKSSLLKNSIIIIGIGLLLWVGYATFLKKDSAVAPGTALVSEAALNGDSPEAQSGREILAILLNLKSLKLDASIFNNSVFQSLTDFGQSIPERPRGRDNPFAPIGAASAPTSVSAKTLF
ncbi:MAG: hypothetical protein HZC04_00320 [Candidatus Lloydbacteria bacterium]|nr:hypothetical protein [Candidatus Lloydbacteria bacterium]